MSRIEEIKSFLDGTLRQRYGEGYPERVEFILDTMLTELESKTSFDRYELESNITRFELISGAGSLDSYSTVASFRGPGHGPLDPWIPHTCHITIELCWPIPDKDGNIYCLEITLPWPCPDKGPITIPPIP